MIFKLTDKQTRRVTFENVEGNYKLDIVDSYISCKSYIYDKHNGYFKEILLWRFKMEDSCKDEIINAIQSATCSHVATNNYVALEGRYA